MVDRACFFSYTEEVKMNVKGIPFMIILYQIPEEDSRAKRLSEILAEEGLEHRYVGKDAAGQTLGDLFAGVA